MWIEMEKLEALTPVGIAELLSGSAGIDFSGESRTERYTWLQSNLVEQRYLWLGRKQRGMVRALMAKVAGLSMPQITRLIRAYRKDGEIRVHGGTRRRFPMKYTAEDLALLIEADRAHQRLSGPATRRILEREWRGRGGEGDAGTARVVGGDPFQPRGRAGE